MWPQSLSTSGKTVLEDYDGAYSGLVRRRLHVSGDVQVEPCLVCTADPARETEQLLDVYKARARPFGVGRSPSATSVRRGGKWT